MTFLHFFYFLFHCFDLFSGIIIFVYQFFIFCFPQSICFLLNFVSIHTAYDALLLLCTLSIAISSVLLLSVCLLESLSLLFPLISNLFICIGNTCSLFSPSTLCLFSKFLLSFTKSNFSPSSFCFHMSDVICCLYLLLMIGVFTVLIFDMTLFSLSSLIFISTVFLLPMIVQMEINLLKAFELLTY